VTQPAFQAAIARLVIDPEFRDRVRAERTAALPEDLTSREQERVMSIVFELGLDATRTLHKSFRLTKLYALLPLTRRLVGPDRLAKEISSFWAANPPVSHYFLDECIAFCDFLLQRVRSGLRIKYLAEIVAYERANLNLRRPRTDDVANEPEFVKFEHDPAELFEQLTKGRKPRAVPALECTLSGGVNAAGEVEWEVC
jgi:hypothetical protein